MSLISLGLVHLKVTARPENFKTPKPEVHNRIIMTPEHAKRLFLALQDNINKYESQHGQIVLGGEPKPGFPMGGFGGGAKS